MQPGKIPLADARIVRLVARVMQAGQVVVRLVVPRQDPDGPRDERIPGIGDGHLSVRVRHAVGRAERREREVAAVLEVPVAQNIDGDPARGFVPAGELHVAVGELGPEQQVHPEARLVVVPAVVVQVEIGDFEIGVNAHETFRPGRMQIRPRRFRRLPGDTLFHDGLRWVGWMGRDLAVLYHMRGGFARGEK